MTELQSSMPLTANSDEDLYRKSSFYEQLVEHVFISEVLQEVWFHFGLTVEVLRSEVDASGYDVVFECNKKVRHVQLRLPRLAEKLPDRKLMWLCRISRADVSSG